MGKIHGLIFLFKCQEESSSSSFGEIIPNHPTLFFANQMISNACATQAILSILMNGDGIELGETLGEFKEFVSEFDAENKGESIELYFFINLVNYYL